MSSVTAHFNSVLFNRDVKTIGKHINNASKEELDNQMVVAKFATTTPHRAIEGKTQIHMTDFYNLVYMWEWYNRKIN